MQCSVITNVINKGRRILKTKISAEGGTNYIVASQGAEELFATLVVVKFYS